MQELIKVTKRELFGEVQNTVDGRDLQEKLGSATEYRVWIKRQLESISAVEGEDYVSRSEKDRLSSTGQSTKEYTLTTDAAKEIAMVQKTAAGKAIRKYLINLEKECRQLAADLINQDALLDLAENRLVKRLAFLKVLRIPEHLALTEAKASTKKLTGIDFTEQIRLSPINDNIPKVEMMLEPSHLGKRCNPVIPRNSVNPMLAYLKYQTKVGNVWEPTALGEHLAEIHQLHGTNSDYADYNYKWNVSRLVPELEELFKTHKVFKGKVVERTT